MKIAVLSDLHGNIVALDAVLKDLRQQESIDRIVVAGDMFTFGPAPTEVLARLQQLPDGALFLLGNTDRYLLEGMYPSSGGNGDWQDKLLYSFDWTARRLGVEGTRFLNALPALQLISGKRCEMLVVHGSPRSDEEGLTVEMDTNEFSQMPIKPEVTILACGHTHIPLDRSVGGLRVVNAGSVGLPFDGDPRACYAIISNLDLNGTGVTRVQLRRVGYDVERVVEQFYERDHPAADIGAYNLRTARSIGSSLIYTAEMRYNSSSSVDGDR